ncbi:hypothetical protein NE237_026735 [Protea cynaroides]|uniref:Uncharacterized protein n=1 Tax=Protea cynaroides TaxID=273540 RepID=A0A9Q0GKL6_9MAGN|nr:hypothetical protein NE237_026735 [Protea cynaroides]
MFRPTHWLLFSKRRWDDFSLRTAEGSITFCLQSFSSSLSLPVLKQQIQNKLTRSIGGKAAAYLANSRRHIALHDFCFCGTRSVARSAFLFLVSLGLARATRSLGHSSEKRSRHHSESRKKEILSAVTGTRGKERFGREKVEKNASRSDNVSVTMWLYEYVDIGRPRLPENVPRGSPRGMRWSYRF